MGNVFVKNKQQQMSEQAEYNPCNADGVKGIEFKHVDVVILTM